MESMKKFFLQTSENMGFNNRKSLHVPSKFNVLAGRGKIVYLDSDFNVSPQLVVKYIEKI